LDENLEEDIINKLFDKRIRRKNKDYSKLLVELAFRKRQVKNSLGRKKELYSILVEDLRKQISNFNL
jgi:hypothetical protein